jgi:alkylated DNA nucleotide flippase Atl1
MKPSASKILLCAALVLGIASTAVFAADSKISTIMKTVMKGDNSTYKAVATGKGSPADATKLANCLKGLAGTKPPKGDEAAWNEKVTALIKAADDVAAKKPGAATALQKAGACKACHSAHKEDK